MIEQEELHQARQLQLRKERKEKQENYQKILYRQYRAQILRRAHEIERELEEDLAVLERVELETRRDENDSTEKRERARQYAQVFSRIVMNGISEISKLNFLLIHSKCWYSGQLQSQNKK